MRKADCPEVASTGGEGAQNRASEGAYERPTPTNEFCLPHLAVQTVGGSALAATAGQLGVHRETNVSI